MSDNNERACPKCKYLSLGEKMRGRWEYEYPVYICPYRGKDFLDLSACENFEETERDAGSLIIRI